MRINCDGSIAIRSPEWRNWRKTTRFRLLRARMFAELATYIAPRAKATDLTGPDGKVLDLMGDWNVDFLTDGELETLIALMGKIGT